MKNYIEKFAVIMLAFGAATGLAIGVRKAFVFLTQFDLPNWVVGFSICVAVALMVAGIKNEE